MTPMFLALPREIRNTIYTHLLTENLYTIGYKYSLVLSEKDYYQSAPSGDCEDPKDLDDDLVLSSYQPHPICHVSTQVRNEATSVFWTRARFALHPCLPPFNIVYPSALCARIQELELDLTRLINSVDIQYPLGPEASIPRSLKCVTLPQFPRLSHLTVTWNCPVGFDPSYWTAMFADEDPNDIYGWHCQLGELVRLMRYKKPFRLDIRINMYSELTTSQFIVPNYELTDVPVKAFWSTCNPSLRFRYRKGESRKKQWEHILITGLRLGAKQIQSDTESLVRRAVEQGGLKLMQADKLLEIIDKTKVEVTDQAWQKYWFPQAFYVHEERSLDQEHEENTC